MTKWFIELSGYHMDHGEDSANSEFFVRETKNQKDALLLAMREKGHKVKWPFDDPWEDCLEVDGEETIYNGTISDWIYYANIRKATDEDIKRINGITNVKHALDQWIEKTVKRNKPVTDVYGSFWMRNILGHHLASEMVKKMSKKELIDFIYMKYTNDFNDDKLAEACLKEFGNVDTIIKGVNTFFRERYPNSIKKP